MKILVVGDPHFKDDNSEETDLLNSEVERIIEEESIDEIVILGDVNDRFKLKSLSRAKEWLIHLSTLLPTTVLVGNHERPDNTDYHGKVHHFVGLEREGLRVVSESMRVRDIMYVPYVANGRFSESVQHAGGLEGVRLVFAHQSFMGCGDPHAKDQWMREVRVISGHIHYNTVLDRGDRSSLDSSWNVYYPGSPLCSSFGDAHERFVCVVDGDEVREVPIKAHPRTVIIFTTDFDEDTIRVISRADKYTRIDLVGNYDEILVMLNSRSIQEARMRGAHISTHKEVVPIAITERKERSNESFSKRLITKMSEEGKWSVEELAELSQILM